MIQLFEIKPCADYHDHIQVEGLINSAGFSVDSFQAFLENIEFMTYSVGNPKVLICKRKDCLMMVHTDGSFNISQVASQEKLTQIVTAIRTYQ